jgi:hypothetical protein
MFDTDNQGDGGGVAFRDVLFLIVFSLVIVIAMLIPYFNPPTEEATETPPGNLIFHLDWPDELDVDLDMWVQGPGGTPVGYSNMGDRQINLLRDDLGTHRDDTKANFEFAYSRGIRAGEYIVNLHYYSQHFPGGTRSAPFTLTVSLKNDGDAESVVLIERDDVIQRAGDEMTLVRFRMDEDGNFLQDSVHDRFIPLRAYRGNRP